MEKEVKDFIDKERVGCLAVSTIDGVPHSSAVHYSSTSEPLKIFIQIGKESRKFAAVNDHDVVIASFTIGFSEVEWKTLQLDGHIRQIRASEDEEFQRVHYAKINEAKKYRGNDTAYLVFEPTWWRFSDFSAGDPPRLIQS